MKSPAAVIAVALLVTRSSGAPDALPVVRASTSARASSSPSHIMRLRDALMAHMERWRVDYTMDAVLTVDGGPLIRGVGEGPFRVDIEELLRRAGVRGRFFTYRVEDRIYHFVPKLEDRRTVPIYRRAGNAFRVVRLPVDSGDTTAADSAAAALEDSGSDYLLAYGDAAIEPAKTAAASVRISARLDRVSLQESLRGLFRAANIPCRIDPSCPNSLLTASLHNVPFRTAFESFLRTTASTGTPVTYRVEDGVFSIAPKIQDY